VAWADVQDAGVQSSGTVAAGGTLSVAFPANVTAGNLVVVAVSGWRSAGVAITSVTDNLGNTYHPALPVAGGLQKAAAGEACGIWYAYNVSGGACTVSVKATSLEYLTIGVGEKSGCPTTDPLDQHNSADCGGTNSASASSGSVTTTTAGELYVGVLNHNGATTTITATGGFTARYTATNGSNECICYSDLGCGTTQAAGTYAATYTTGANVPWSAAIATFLPAAGGGTSYTRTAADSPSTSEAAARAFSGSRTATAAPATSEAASRAFAGSRNAADAPSASDGLTRGLLLSRSASESPATSEAAGRTLAGSRAAVDAPATAVTATSLTATGTPWTASNLATPQLGLAGLRVFAPVTGVTTAPCYANIVSNTTSVLTLDQWWNAADGVATTPAGTNSFIVAPGGAAAFRFVALTTNATAPAATDTTLTGEITTGGCGRALGTYAHTLGAATLTLTKAFSVSATFTAIHKAGVFSALSSAGADPMIYSTALNLDATVGSGDTLTLTWTATLSG
jgi:hypothetical protein